MKKIKLLICALLVGAVSSSSAFASSPEDGNPFKPSTNTTRYEPLEVEMVDVTADQPSRPTSHTPWYKSKRFWYGAAAVTTVVATTAAVTYAIVKATSGEDSHHDVPNMPSVSPIPSFINNITESVTSSLSRSWSSIASHSPFPSPTTSPSWSQSLSNSWSAIASRSASWSSSWSESLSSTFSSSMSALETMTSSVTESITSTFSPSPSHSTPSTYDIWSATCRFIFDNASRPIKVTCIDGIMTPGCSQCQGPVGQCPYHGCYGVPSLVTDTVYNFQWRCLPQQLPSGRYVHTNFTGTRYIG